VEGEDLHMLPLTGSATVGDGAGCGKMLHFLGLQIQGYQFKQWLYSA